MLYLAYDVRRNIVIKICHIWRIQCAIYGKCNMQYMAHLYYFCAGSYKIKLKIKLKIELKNVLKIT